jgi:hypothetical protein
MGFTNMKILSLAKEKNVVFHIDCTYKVIKQLYPLIVFGITDIDHHFHPIALMITSHEQTIDFVRFFRSLNKLIKEKLNYNFSPTFIITDHSSAMFNAIEKDYKSLCQHITCFFHLMLNVIIKNVK